MSMPGSRGQVQFEVQRECFGDRGTIVAKRSERTNGTAELQGENARTNFREPNTMANNGLQPASNDKSEGSGKRLLHPGARHHGSRAMFFREADERAAETLQILFVQFQRSAKSQHYSCVDGILTGGAPMNKARGVLVVFGDSLGEAFDDGDCQVASLCRVLRYEVQVEILHAALCDDGTGTSLRNDS